MPDNLSTIRQVIEQHRLITKQVGSVGGRVNDIEALFALQRAHSSWAQSSVEALSEKENQLNETISLLDTRLRSHFAFEEKALPPILGDVLMKALVLVHRGIAADMEKVKAAAGRKLEGLPQEELLSAKADMQRLTGGVTRRIEEHASHEELILNMAKDALEAEAQGR